MQRSGKIKANSISLEPDAIALGVIEQSVTGTRLMTTEIKTISSNLENWQPLTKVADVFPQFTKPQLKRLFWQRQQHPGLSLCYRQVGKRGYICLPLFGMWLAGQLSESHPQERL